ncbi:MAG: 3'-5' exonuclease [Candidatus Obscuribacterales bacterium]|nr:3'-5' exonuclease [Candidatus Obscuribacterales bacterium]
MNLLPNPLPAHPKPQDRDLIIDWARERLSKRDFVILDTETTGTDESDEVVQIGIIGPDGEFLIDSLVRPERPRTMPAKAQEVHGISIEMLEDAPTMFELAIDIMNAIAGRSVVCFNDTFDMRLIEQTDAKYNISGRGRSLEMKSRCAMIAYAQFIGQKGKYSNEYAWQKLPRRVVQSHKAVDDCKLTLDLIQEISDILKSTEPAEFNWRMQPSLI